jgi:hypothetical protein
VFGGYSSGAYDATTECIVNTSQVGASWVYRASMPAAREGAVSFVRVRVALEGVCQRLECTARCRRVIAIANAQPRPGVAFVCGGYNGVYLSSCASWDPARNTWQVQASMNFQRYLAAAADHVDRSGMRKFSSTAARASDR